MNYFNIFSLYCKAHFSFSERTPFRSDGSFQLYGDGQKGTASGGMGVTFGSGNACDELSVNFG